jgi:hypothetical protein
MVYILGRKPNYTPIAKHFKSATPISERFIANPAGNRRPPGPCRMMRLSFGALTAKEDRSIHDLYNLIARGPLNSTFVFPDTGFITNAIHPGFWTLGAGRHIAFPEMTIAELSGWSSYPMHNAYLHSWLPRALRQCAASPIQTGSLYRVHNVLGAIGYDLVPFSVAIADKGRFRPYGYDYYVNLLSLRKRLGLVVFRELQNKLGRAPTEQELKQHLNNKYHPSAANIAFKGWKDQGKRNYLADEELVVTAVLTAIVIGKETLVLTWDTDVFDQFTKLVQTLSSNYTCFRVSEVHFHNPEDCPMWPMEIQQDPNVEIGFEGKTIHHVVLPESEKDQLWPQSFTPVHAYCVLLGNNCVEPKVSIAAFCLETEMTWMLEAKGVTGGKNTVHFPGRNMAVGTSLSDDKIHILFILGKERYVNYESINVSWIDLQHVLKPDPLIIRRRDSA